jgi:YegS/Rv2252/BmrU family lipid kinase
MQGASQEGIKSAVRTHMPNALLMVNPNSRRGEVIREEIENTLRTLGVEFVNVGPCHNPSAVQDLLREFATDRLIVAGGDGTVKCAAEAIYGRNVVMGIVPAGTANNLSRTLGIPTDVQKACEIIAQGKTQTIDIARVNGSYFVSVAGIGVSTHVHRSIDSQKKKKMGPLAYGLEALDAIKKSKGFRYKIKIDNQVIEGKAIQLTVCNGKHFGALLEVREDATATDHVLDLLVLDKIRWFQGLLNIVFRNEGAGVRKFVAKTIEVHTHPRQAIDVEGKIVGYTPATFEIVPGAIDIFVPESVQKAA